MHFKLLAIIFTWQLYLPKLNASKKRGSKNKICELTRFKTKSSEGLAHFKH